MKGHLRLTDGVSIIVILITLFVCPGLYAAEETLPTPEEIIAKNIEAIGGIKALKKIKNKKLVTIRKGFQRNMEFKVTEYQERPNNYYQSENTGFRVGSNGKMVWIVNPHGGVRLLEGDQLSNILRWNSFDGRDGPDVPYKSMKTEGIERIDGRACYKVVKTPGKGWERIVYYDKKSFMIVKTAHNTEGNKKIETYIEEYMEINGILFPYKQVSFLNGQRREEITWEKIELNIEMPEGIFDIPEEVKAIMNKK